MSPAVAANLGPEWTRPPIARLRYMMATRSWSLYYPQDLNVAQTLAHIATVAILQEHAPTPDVVLPRMHGALASQIVVEQAKGFIRARLDVPIDEAFALLRAYARAHGVHLSELARALISDPDARTPILTAISELRSTSVPAEPPR